MNIPTHPSHAITDGTKIDAYITCPRKYFYEYVLGWRPEDSAHDLNFGSAVHIALEYIYDQWHKNGPGYHEADLQTAYILFCQDYRAKYGPDTDCLYPNKNPEWFRHTLWEYAKKYNVIDKFEVLHAEVSGGVPVATRPDGSLVMLYFRLDTLIREDDGLHSVLEHKTSSFAPTMWARGWHMRIQPGTANWICHLLFDKDVYGCIMNGLHFIRRKEPTCELSRLPITYTPAMLEEWRQRAADYIQAIESDYHRMQHEDSPSAPTMRSFRPSGHCVHYNRICPYYDLCTTWNNPLANCSDIPPGFEQTFWDPREQDKLYQSESAKRM